MKKRLLFILCLFFVAAGAAKAQTRTVSNADLEKFRQKRLQAERDYRENYARLGFPSPEELERQREVDRKNLSEFSARLQREADARERAEREDELRAAQFNALLNAANGGDNRRAYGYYDDGFYGNGFYGAYPFYYYPNGFYRGGGGGFRRGEDFGRGRILKNPRGGFSDFGVRRGAVRIIAPGGGFGSSGGGGRPR